MRKKICWVLIFICLAGISYGSLKLYERGKYRAEKITRYARMVDTSAQHSQVKGNHYYNTYGIFVDRETGLRFRDDIDDSLYRQFERDGNKPIDVSWPYSIDKREQASIGYFYQMLAWFGWAVVAIISGVCVADLLVSVCNRNKKPKESKTIGGH